MASKEFPTCPVCGDAAINSLPISENEFYKVDIDGNRNVELSFGRAKG